MQELTYPTPTGMRTQTRYSGEACLQYSCGGIGNGVPLMTTDYPVVPNISVLFPSSNKARPVTEITVANGFNAKTPPFGFFSYQNTEALKNGDLYGFINGLVPDGINDHYIKTLKDTMQMVDQISLVQTKPSKKGFLKGLLGKNAALDNELDAFKKGKDK